MAQVELLRADATRLRHVAVVGADADITAALVRVLTVGGGEAPAETAGLHGLSITPLVFEETEPSGSHASYLVNVIDARDSAHCVVELDAALALSDSVLVVVDYGDGAVSLLVETALTRAVVADKQILLLINKMGKALADPRSVRSTALERIVAAVNEVIREASSSKQDFQARRVSPEHGTVAFGSLVGHWGFTLTQLGAFYSPCFDLDEDELARRLWSEWSFNADHSQWIPASDLQARAFDTLVAEPLRQALFALRKNDRAKAQQVLTSMGIQASRDAPDSDGSIGLARWLPLRSSVLKMIIRSAPSPVSSQQHIVSSDQYGWSDDVRSCRARGALVARVVKLLPPSQHHGCLAVARVLSGTIVAHQDLHVVTYTRADPATHELRYPSDPNSIQSCTARVQAVGLLIGGRVFALTDETQVHAGNLCVLSGVDEAMYKTGMVTTCEPGQIATSDLFRRLVVVQWSSTPMTVRVTLTPTNSKQRSDLLAAMVRLAAIDLAIECYAEESGELTLAATTSKALERGLASLRVGLTISFSVSAPCLCYRETMTAPSPRVFLSKSPNKNVKIRCEAEPLDLALARDLALTQGLCLARRQARLISAFGWNETHVSKILGGLEDTRSGANLLLDQTVEPHIRFNLLQGPMLTGLVWATMRGVLCEEPLFGVLVKLRETWLFGMERHWGASQTIVATRRIIMACQLASSPALLEPVLAVEIRCNARNAVVCAEWMAAHGARVDSQNPDKTLTRYHLRVRESFGLDDALRAAIGGEAELKLVTVFDHYDRVEGDPLDPESTAGRIVRELRLRKHLDAEIKPLVYFHDTDQ